MNIQTFHADRGCLSYLLYDKDTLEGILIDPTSELENAYEAFIKSQNISLLYSVETHTHADHSSSSWDIHGALGTPVALSHKAPSSRNDHPLHDGDTLSFGSHTLTVWETPGHTEDSLSFVTEGHIFTGDTLLLGGTGRTDFQGGSSKDLYQSLKRILTLPASTTVHPGHDYKNQQEAPLSHQREHNARLKMVAEGKESTFVELMDNHHPPKPELFDSSISYNAQ